MMAKIVHSFITKERTESFQDTLVNHQIEILEQEKTKALSIIESRKKS